jgi:hypothetical protein
MKCEHKIAELLPWYITETLSQDERKKVETHLKVCSICQKSLQDLQWFSENMEKYKVDLLQEHIEPEKLVIYAESRNELSDSEITEIEEHLRECTDCREDLDILRKVNADLGKIPSLLVRLKAFLGKLVLKLHLSLQFKSRKKVNFITGRPMLRPVFVYALALVLFYPAWIGLRSKIFHPKIIGAMRFQIAELEDQSRALNERVSHLDSQVQFYKQSSDIGTFKLQQKLTWRGPAQRQVGITVPPSHDIINLMFSVPVRGKVCQYDLEIYQGNSLIMAHKDIKPDDEMGNFSYILRAKSLSDGEYEVRVTEVCPDDIELSSKFIYEFNVSQE